MTDTADDKTPAPGWIGGYAESNPAFAYPEPNLSSMEVRDNMDNIDKLDRQQNVFWPEFSWQVCQGDDNTRCFCKFAENISRLGYTNEGKIYSIICPQQGACTMFGALNVEVTVTGNRGWVNELNKDLAGDMSVIGKIWFSETAKNNPHVKRLQKHMQNRHPTYNFPISKEFAIDVLTNVPGGTPADVLFPLKSGESENFIAPEFARHEHEAWAVANLEVQIGKIRKTGIKDIDRFNQDILDVFNAAKGNMLQAGNILTWNVWFQAPSIVDRTEWLEHAKKWRKAIDSPDTPKRYEGSPTYNRQHEEMDFDVYSEEDVANAAAKLILHTERKISKCSVQ